MQGLVQFIIGADISLIEDNVVIDAYMDYRDEMSELVGSFENSRRGSQLNWTGLGLMALFNASSGIASIGSFCAITLNA